MTARAETGTAQSSHRWAPAWEALSPLRRGVLRARIVDREGVADIAARLDRPAAEVEELLSSSLRTFRREVVLGVGTGYAEACGSVVLRRVDSAGDSLSRPDRTALASHAATCSDCASAVEAMLELDARLRDGLLDLLSARGSGSTVPAPRVGGARLGSTVNKR